MHAAIKTLEDTLLIRRLQARDLGHERENAERIAVINEDIASLERGLSALKAREADDGRQPARARPGTTDDRPENTEPKQGASCSI